MPARNRIKIYEAGAYYHLYNRGVAKRPVFLDDQDFAVWQSYLRTYLLPKNTKELEAILASDRSTSKEKDKAVKLLRMNNFADVCTLHAYCFMQNHFHMLVHQKESDVIDRFMNSLGTRYAMYFNKKYKRVGPLFQGVYKAVRVTSEEQLLYLTKYIHLNADFTYPYSSLSSYLGVSNEKWIDSSTILTQARLNLHKYKDFIGDKRNEEMMMLSLKPIIVDF